MKQEASENTLSFREREGVRVGFPDEAGKHRKILRSVKAGRLGVEKALDRLRHLPYENLDFARIDHHRHLRQGMPEVIYCEGKKVPGC